MNRTTTCTVTALMAATVGLANVGYGQVSRNDSSTGPASGLTVVVGRSTGTGYSPLRGTDNGADSGAAITGDRRTPVTDPNYTDFSIATEIRSLLPMYLLLSLPSAGLLVYVSLRTHYGEMAHLREVARQDTAGGPHPVH